LSRLTSASSTANRSPQVQFRFMVVTWYIGDSAWASCCDPCPGWACCDPCCGCAGCDPCCGWALACCDACSG
jgi:hypothetical protein